MGIKLGIKWWVSAFTTHFIEHVNHVYRENIHSPD